MTTEVIHIITNAETELKASGVPQKIKDLEFRLPNDSGLNGIFQTTLVNAEGTDKVDLLLQGHGDPFTASVSRSTLLSNQVTIAPGRVRTAIEKLIERINPPSSTNGHMSVGRTRY